MRTTLILLVAVIGLSSMVKAQGFISNCATVNNAVTPPTCTTCATGYTSVDGGKQCNKCPDGCATCDATTKICSACTAGNYVFNGLCYTCGAGCSACDANGVCTRCDNGFGLNSAKQCVQCPANCATCTTTGTCDSCNSGYQLGTGSNGAVCNWAPGSSVSNAGATPGAITWLVVLFIVCAAIFILICYALFRPSYHTGEAGQAYVPLNQGQKPIPVPLPAQGQVQLQPQQRVVAPVVASPVYAAPVVANPPYTLPVVTGPVQGFNTQPVVARVSQQAPGTTIYGNSPRPF